MELFHNRFPEIAEREGRTLNVLAKGAPGSLPKGEYGFVEFYCNDKGCDCRRVMIQMMTLDSPRPLATISLGFDSGHPDAGPFLDPLSPQSEHSEILMQYFLREINENPEYLGRLHRHYVLFKEKVESRPYRERPFEKPGSVVRTVREPGPITEFLNARVAEDRDKLIPVVRSSKTGRNNPCPCGSGKKYKKCCLGKALVMPVSEEGQTPVEVSAKPRTEGLEDESAADADRLIARAAKRNRTEGADRLVGNAYLTLLETRPRTTLAILNRLLDVHAPDGRQVELSPQFDACLHLLEEGLTQIRYSVERGRPWAIALSKEIQERIADRAFLPEVDVRVYQGLLRVLHESKLEIHPAIKAHSGKLAKYYAPFMAGKESVAEFVGAIERLAKDSAEDAFDLFDNLVAQLATAPAEAQALAFASAAHETRHQLVLEMASLCPLHPNRTVARAASSLLANAWRPNAAVPVALRRLVALRNWLPGEDRAPVDELIKVQQKACGAAGSGPARLPSPRAANLLASSFDGSGVQAGWWLCDLKRPFYMVGFLVKQGEGIRDILMQMNLTKREIRGLGQDFRDSGAAPKPVNAAYGERLISHFLWVGTEQNRLPPAALLQAAETLGRDYWVPRRTDPNAELARLEERRGQRFDSDPAFVQRVLERSIHWPSEEEFASSWFEDDARVDTLLRDTVGPPARWRDRLKRASQVLVKELLETKRDVWAERMLWMALWAEAVKERPRPSWENFAVISHLLTSNAPLKEIPLMTAVAARSVLSAVRRTEDRHTG